MRKIIYIIIAIFLVLTLYIITMKTGPEKTPAGAASRRGEGGVPRFVKMVLDRPLIGSRQVSPATVSQYVHHGGSYSASHMVLGLEPPPRFLPGLAELLIETVQSTGAISIDAKTLTPFLVTGTFSGLLSYDEAEGILTKIFTDLDVEKIQKMQDGNLISWGGYSPKITQFLRDLTGEPINIQCALRYNSIEDHTYLHLGSPIIYAEY